MSFVPDEKLKTMRAAMQAKINALVGTQNSEGGIYSEPGARRALRAELLQLGNIFKDPAILDYLTDKDIKEG
ncbi:MAG: hypothetical protein FWC26_06615 [Fibromonadales bacterium]|nr:hypothetical protein [Fibromonadales bacterium]